MAHEVQTGDPQVASATDSGDRVFIAKCKNIERVVACDA